MDAVASDEALDRLAAALADERRALLEHDIELLVRSTRDKLESLRHLEADLPSGRGERLAELAEANRSNGALLARRRREVSWALRQLGRSEASSAYDAKGQAHLLHTRKPLAVA